MSQDTGSPDPSRESLSFEDRLKAARSKQGLDAPPKQSPGNGPLVKQPMGDQGGLGGSAWSIGLRVGIELVSALVVAVAIGYGLDRLFHTTPILTAVFVPLGGAAGVVNLWRMFAPKQSGNG
jgi:ATP synthase protein I